MKNDSQDGFFDFHIHYKKKKSTSEQIYYNDGFDVVNHKNHKNLCINFHFIIVPFVIEQICCIPSRFENEQIKSYIKPISSIFTGTGTRTRTRTPINTLLYAKFIFYVLTKRSKYESHLWNIETLKWINRACVDFVTLSFWFWCSSFYSNILNAIKWCRGISNKV